MSWFKRNKGLLRVVCFYAIVSFLSSAIVPPNIQAAEIKLPAPNQFVQLSSAYSFPVLKGLKFDPATPFEIKFIIDTADAKTVSEEEAAQLIRYFLAGLTIPEDELWVNMSPYEQDKMIPANLAVTDLGKDLLSQDYILKQISSSLTYPESEIGKDFWTRTYEEILNIAKTTNLPINTFNKIWIVPDRAVVYENAQIGLITEATLRAMLEEDYLALKSNVSDIQKQKKNLQEALIEQINKISSGVMRQVILPKINQEVNSGKNFATLRQIHCSLILAAWFKEKFKQSIYKYYIDKGKVAGIDLADKGAKDKIYNLYVEAFKKGIYNYIKTDTEPQTRRKIKRQYFSGGFAENGSPDGSVIDARLPITEQNRARVISSALGANPEDDKSINIRIKEPAGSQAISSDIGTQKKETLARIRGILDSDFADATVIKAELDNFLATFGDIKPLKTLRNELAGKVKRLTPAGSTDSRNTRLVELYSGLYEFIEAKEQRDSSTLAVAPVNSFQELSDRVLTPEALQPSLANIGLTVKNVSLQPLDIPLNKKFAQPLSQEENLMSLGSLVTSIFQSLGTTYIIELQKIMDKKKADNTSLALGVSALINFTSTNPDVAVVSWGSEGPRDQSWGIPEWTIIYRGTIYRNKTKEGFALALTHLKAGNPTLIVIDLLDDALEVTNAVVKKRTGEDPNSWAATAVFTHNDSDNPESDSSWRIAGISYHAPKLLKITPFTPPREFYQELAQAYGISLADKEAVAQFMSQQLMVVLYKSSFDEKARVNHEFIYNEGEELENEYPGFKALGPGDGDLDKRIFSITGQTINGHKVTVFGRSGSIEGAIANGVASFTPNGYFVNTRVSPKGTEKILSPDSAHNFIPEELAEAERLGYRHEELTKFRTGKETKGSGAVALTVVNDALEGQFGKDKDLYKGVTVEQRESQNPIFSTSTILITSQGPVLVKTQLESVDLVTFGKNIESVYAQIQEHVEASSALTRKPFVGGNWKMRKDLDTEEKARAKAREFRTGLAEIGENAKIVIFVEDRWTKAISEELKGSNISVGVQSFHFDPNGNIEAQIEEAVQNGDEYAMVGHSMHRAPDPKVLPGIAALTNEGANKINRAILKDGRLKLWYVIGVDELVDGQGNPLLLTSPQQTEYIRNQIFDGIRIGLAGVTADELTNIVITPEPMRDISTKSGAGVIDPKTKVNFPKVDMLARITSEMIRQKFGYTVKVNTGYGASAGPDTSETLLSHELVFNILPGGKSLEVKDFKGTIEGAIKGASGKEASSALNTPGGIDLGGINVKAARGSLPLDVKNLPAIDLSNIKGFTFEIIGGIEPLTPPNFNAFFGVVSKENEQGKESEKLALKN